MAIVAQLARAPRYMQGTVGISPRGWVALEPAPPGWPFYSTPTADGWYKIEAYCPGAVETVVGADAGTSGGQSYPVEESSGTTTVAGVFRLGPSRRFYVRANGPDLPIKVIVTPLA